MAWLWSDTLAALLMEHDLVCPDRVASMTAHLVAYRLAEGENPLDLARIVMRRSEEGRLELS
ncbi:MAG TPA: hypothetical protein VLL51_01770 [Gemmatimonadales bacterium]|nr:hypothetical protein [Gemmatimonadales bacterium]